MFQYISHVNDDSVIWRLPFSFVYSCYRHCLKREAPSSSRIRFGHIKADSCAFLNYIDFLRARSKCSIFNHRLFRACHGRVHPTSYYEVCLEDACTCGVNDPCHCESISAYANECERRGLKISGWKDLTSCSKL